MHTRGPESAGTTVGFIERIHRHDRYLHHRCDNHLCNPGSALDDKGFVSVIDQDDFYLAAVVRVDRPWRVQDSDAVFYGKTGPRPDLGFETFGQRDDETCGYEGAHAWSQRERGIRRHCRRDVETGSMKAFIGRGGQTFPVSERQNPEADRFCHGVSFMCIGPLIE